MSVLETISESQLNADSYQSLHKLARACLRARRTRAAQPRTHAGSMCSKVTATHICVPPPTPQKIRLEMPRSFAVFKVSIWDRMRIHLTCS